MELVSDDSCAVKVCETCAERCHKGHDLRTPEIKAHYCDCDEYDGKCKAKKPRESFDPDTALVIPPIFANTTSAFVRLQICGTESPDAISVGIATYGLDMSKQTRIGIRGDGRVSFRNRCESCNFKLSGGDIIVILFDRIRLAFKVTNQSSLESTEWICVQELHNEEHDCATVCCSEKRERHTAHDDTEFVFFVECERSCAVELLSSSLPHEGKFNQFPVQICSVSASRSTALNVMNVSNKYDNADFRSLFHRLSLVRCSGQPGKCVDYKLPILRAVDHL